MMQYAYSDKLNLYLNNRGLTAEQIAWGEGYNKEQHILIEYQYQIKTKIELRQY